MGEAKIRGTFEERKKQAIEKNLFPANFSLTTEIKATIKWDETEIITESHKKFEEDIQELANFMNEDLPKIILTALKENKIIVF